MRYCIAAIAFFSSSFSSAQDLLPDSVVYQMALNQTLSYNNSRTARTSGLYTGSLYARDYYNVKGHPFFQIDSFQRGNVFYNGVFYKNVDLLYDLSHDNVITKYSDDAKLVLVAEKIERFDLNGHSFVRELAAPAGDGFYEVLYAGKIEILAKRTKKMVPWSKTLEYNSVFTQDDNYFLYKGANYSVVNSKKELVDALSDKKTEIRDFMSKIKTEFRKNFDAALIKTAAYYDQISK